MADKEYTDTEITLKCVDENEILYDELGKYVEEILSTPIDCSETLYHDILRNLTECKDILLMSLKQRIIMNESRVRFNARNDVAGLQAQIADINLPKVCKNYLRDISNQGYKILKDSNFLDHLVEFDAEQFTNVCIFGRKVKMVGRFDMLAMTDKLPKQTKLKNSLEKAQTKPNRVADDREADLDSEDSDQASVTETNSEDLRKVVVTVAVTARNYVSISDIFRQFLYMYLQKISRFFLLVFHIGPLVEKQKVVLYEYKPPKGIVKLVNLFQHTSNTSKCNNEVNIQFDTKEFVVSQTVQKTDTLGPSERLEEDTESNDLDVSQLEAEFRKIKGKHLQKMSPLKDYFRYMVYDCPGVKDHQTDSKARYDRYTAKREKKRELKKMAKAARKAMDKETNGQSEPEGTVVTNNAEFESTFTNKTNVIDEI